MDGGGGGGEGEPFFASLSAEAKMKAGPHGKRQHSSLFPRRRGLGVLEKIRQKVG